MFKNRLLFYLLITSSAIIIALIIDFYIDKQFSFHDIFVEFHGLVFDLFVFGIIIVIYDKIKSKKDKVTRYMEELDDYRYWKSEEASFKIMGLLRRLVDNGQKEINLVCCHLPNMFDATTIKSFNDMTKWRFREANLNENTFHRINMSYCSFITTKLENTNFFHVNLTGSVFHFLGFKKTIFYGCDLTNVFFELVTVPSIDWFDDLEEKKNIGIESIREKYVVIETDNSYKPDEKAFVIVSIEDKERVLREIEEKKNK